MKQYFLKTAVAASVLAFFVTGAYAQDEVREQRQKTRRNSSEDMIVITPKVSTDTKLTIEIKGDMVTINGKPMADFKSDDVSVSKRKHFDISVDDMAPLAEMDAMRAPITRFRATPKVYSYNYNYNMDGNSNKAFLGVGTHKEEDGEGVEITNVTDESAAEKAGLKEGDIITKINDSKVNSPEELTKTIGKFNPDDKINITYKRNKKEQKTVATLTKRKGERVMTYNSDDFNAGKKNFNYDFKLAPLNGDNFAMAWGRPRLGLKAQETEEGKGLKVLDVDDESPADKAGIKEGDIINSFDGTEVSNIDVLRDLSKAAIEKGNFKINITRDGKPQEITVKIPKKLKSGDL